MHDNVISEEYIENKSTENLQYFIQHLIVV